MNKRTETTARETARTDKILIRAGCLQEHIERLREFRWSLAYLHYIACYNHDSKEETFDIYKRELRNEDE